MLRTRRWLTHAASCSLTGAIVRYGKGPAGAPDIRCLSSGLPFHCHCPLRLTFFFKETEMRTLIASVALALLSTLAHAGNAACDTKALEKKLSGAAKTSFLKKCERDAAATAPNAVCLNKAAEKKLAGAAKNSFVKKCEKDAAAAAPR